MSHLSGDTIAAVATAPGPGAIAVVRVSGPDALTIYRTVAPEAAPDPEPRRVCLVELRGPEGEALDRALVTYFQAPASYTGEDMLEISCHGGALVPTLVLDAVLAAGARLAEPGEFTRRAYLRGKMDLVQAEAVADLVEARSTALHRAALHQLERGLSGRVSELRAGVLELEAVLVHHIDFPEEDDAPVPLAEIEDRARALAADMDALLRTAPEGELLREGALTVLAGRPNAGKSSLYNALLGYERAIVTEEPGTTRDALEALIQVGGYPFRLVDTAGLRETEGRVERMGIEVAQRYLERAHLVLYCLPAPEEPTAEDERFVRLCVEAEGRGTARTVVLVRTKRDLGGRADASELASRCAAEVEVSVESGEGLDRLRSVLPSLVFGTLAAAADTDAPVLTRRRQMRALRQARDEVLGFADSLAAEVPPEVAAAHLRSAETALEELLGVISVEDVLDVVFREFCVGK